MIEVVREWFDAFAAEDMIRARRLFPDDAVLHVGADQQHRGLDELLAWYDDKREATGDAFRYELVELMSGSDHVAALINLRTDSMEWKQVALYRVVEDHITDIWIFEEDPSPAL